MIRFLPFGLLILSIYCMMLRQSYVEPKYDVLPCNTQTMTAYSCKKMQSK